jgi:protoporphyrinogen/coproporphyrinogen III oxidase
VYAGDADRMSLAAATPQIAALAEHRSLLFAARRTKAPADSGPVFLAPRGGMGELIDALVAALPDGAIQVDCRRGVPAGDAGPTVLATPADVTADLVGDAAPTAARMLRAIPLASVAMATLVVPDAALPDLVRSHSGYLVPKPEQRTVTACSFATTKWPHWRRDDGLAILRISAGRHGDERALALSDDDLVTAALDDVARHLGVARAALTPVDCRVTRWPRSFPQYLPGHVERVAAIDADLAEHLPGVVAGGAWRAGVGIPACIRDAQRMASATVSTVDRP